MNGSIELDKTNIFGGKSVCTLKDLLDLSQETKGRLLRALCMDNITGVTDDTTNLVRLVLSGELPEEASIDTIIEMDNLQLSKNVDVGVALQVFGTIYAEKDFQEMSFNDAIVGLMNLIKRGILPSANLFRLTTNRLSIKRKGNPNKSKSRMISLHMAAHFFDNWFNQNVAHLSQDQKDAFNAFMNTLQ